MNNLCKLLFLNDKKKGKKMQKNLETMFFKLPGDLKRVLKERAELERITLAGLTISCIKTGLAHRLNTASIEDKKINELLQGAGVNE